MTQPCSPTEEANNEEGNTTKVLLVNINVNSKSSDKSINNKNITRHILFFQSQRKGRRPMCLILQERFKLKKTAKALRFNYKEERKKKTSQKTKTLQLKKCLNFKCIAEYLPPDTVSFIESQVEMSKRCKRAYRWKTKDKMIALSIFFHSRKVYKILSKLFISPSKSTLLRDLKKMNMKPGFIESILEALQVKVNTMDTRDRNVALVFDEMSIKEGITYNTRRDIVEGFGLAGQTRFLANHAIAFIMKGLASKWKQPIGYFLSAGPIKASVLQTLTKSCITKLQAIDINVVALICDQGSNNRSFW